jgi:hypothetical protein
MHSHNGFFSKPSIQGKPKLDYEEGRTLQELGTSKLPFAESKRVFADIRVYR